MLDVRNHGGSDYHNSMTYKEMVEDVIRVMDKLFIEKFTLLGHSVGGKIAMTLATLFPDRLDGLIVLDTIPIDSYDSQSTKNSIEIIKKSLEYDIPSKRDRKKVYEDFITLFGKIIADTLMDNIEYDLENKGMMKWNCNLKAIYENLENLMGFKKYGEYKGDTVVIYGEKSRPVQLEVYKNIFPNIKEDDLKKIFLAGHLVHLESPHQVIMEITKFLDKIDMKDSTEKI